MEKLLEYYKNRLHMLCVKYRHVLSKEEAWNINTALGLVYQQHIHNVADDYWQTEVNEEYGSRTHDEELSHLLYELQVLEAKLKERGISVGEAMKMLSSKVMISNIEISADGIIYFIDFKTSIRLTPMQATLYILIMTHEEGISAKELCNYRDELMAILDSITIARGLNRNISNQRKNIERLLYSTTGAINENVSRIKRAMIEGIGDVRVARNYYINSMRCHKMRIPIDRSIVDIKI